MSYPPAFWSTYALSRKSLGWPRLPRESIGTESCLARKRASTKPGSRSLTSGCASKTLQCFLDQLRAHSPLACLSNHHQLTGGPSLNFTAALWFEMGMSSPPPPCRGKYLQDVRERGYRQRPSFRVNPRNVCSDSYPPPPFFLFSHKVWARIIPLPPW